MENDISASNATLSANPFAAPVAGSTDSDRTTETNRLAAVGEVVVMWEKLRLVYNVIMIPFALAMFGLSYLLAGRQVVQEIVILPVGGLLANLCFCVGPLVDGYLTFFGFRHRLVPMLLFIFGLLFTMVLATMVLVFSHLI